MIFREEVMIQNLVNIAANQNNSKTVEEQLLRIAVDYSKPSITIESSWIVLVIMVLAAIFFVLIIRLVYRNYGMQEMEVEFSGSPKVKFKVQRNVENLYIANRIYIELTTRKAAIRIQEENDVIDEVYDSWYKLFNIIRDEIKTVPGQYLKEHDPTEALIGLTSKILNEGLRPHLTQYQARFRKWYRGESGKPENQNLTPQEIQQKYPQYRELVNSMLEVNDILMQYSNELHKLIKGK